MRYVVPSRAFLVCSFGELGEFPVSYRLITDWIHDLCQKLAFRTRQPSVNNTIRCPQTLVTGTSPNNQAQGVPRPDAAFHVRSSG